MLTFAISLIAFVVSNAILLSCPSLGYRLGENAQSSYPASRNSDENNFLDDSTEDGYYSSESVDLSESEEEPSKMSTMVIDDMIIVVDDFKPEGRSGLINMISGLTWPGNTVVYDISPSFTTYEVRKISRAMAEIRSKTCIRFKRRTTEAVYVEIIGDKNAGCSSYLGRVTEAPPQKLNLAPGCIHHGIIVHELMHAIGIIHGVQDNFEKWGPERASTFDLPYDYGSIMHYPPYAFSRNGLPTIVPKVAGAVLGQLNGMSEGDALKINKMYGCAV